MEHDDTTLVLACRRGDESAWNVLVTRYERLIYSIALRTGLSHDQASDVYQRVFMLLLEHLDRIDEPSTVGAWLITTTKREAWRLRRRERIAGQLFVADTFADTLIDEEPSPQDQLLHLEEQSHLRTAVAALDTRCQTLLMMLYSSYTSPPYADIAKQLGTSEGSIGPTRARCLQKLRRLLENT